WPFGEERVGTDDVVVEVCKRERIFFDEQLIGLSEFLRFDQFQFLREHERDFRQLDREWDDVDAKELVKRDGAFERLAFAHFAHTQKNIALESLHFAVRDKEKISRAAGRVEHAKRAKISKDFPQFADIFPSGIDALAPRSDDCRPDDFANVKFA